MITQGRSVDLADVERQAQYVAELFSSVAEAAREARLKRAELQSRLEQALLEVKAEGAGDRLEACWDAMQWDLSHA